MASMACHRQSVGRESLCCLDSTALPNKEASRPAFGTHCRKTGTGAEMLWVRVCSITLAELLTLVESKTCEFHEVGLENAIPICTRLSKCRRTSTR